MQLTLEAIGDEIGKFLKGKSIGSFIWFVTKCAFAVFVILGLLLSLMVAFFHSAFGVSEGFSEHIGIAWLGAALLSMALMAIFTIGIPLMIDPARFIWLKVVGLLLMGLAVGTCWRLLAPFTAGSPLVNALLMAGLLMLLIMGAFKMFVPQNSTPLPQEYKTPPSENSVLRTLLGLASVLIVIALIGLCYKTAKSGVQSLVGSGPAYPCSFCYDKEGEHFCFPARLLSGGVELRNPTNENFTSHLLWENGMSGPGTWEQMSPPEHGTFNLLQMSSGYWVGTSRNEGKPDSPTTLSCPL